MRVIIGESVRPQEAQALERRIWLRRLAAKMAGDETRYVEVDRIASADRCLALSFRPRLREDVELAPSTVRAAGFELQIDPDEYDLLSVCDGLHSVQDAAALVCGRPLDDASMARALDLLETLGRFDMLVTGVQGPS